MIPQPDMEQITAPQLKSWLDDSGRKRPKLLDVREPWEYQLCHITGSTHMPMHTVPMRAGELDRDEEIVVVCHHGARSMQVALFLERQGYGKLFNLHGGVNAWARQVDPSMATY